MYARVPPPPSTRNLRRSPLLVKAPPAVSKNLLCEKKRGKKNVIDRLSQGVRRIRWMDGWNLDDGEANDDTNNDTNDDNDAAATAITADYAFFL